MENIKDELYQLSEKVHKMVRVKKRQVHKFSDDEFKVYLEEGVALERVATLLSTAGYILDRLK
jgi:phosphoribosylpyrophosphate synthetase